MINIPIDVVKSLTGYRASRESEINTHVLYTVPEDKEREKTIYELEQRIEHLKVENKENLRNKVNEANTIIVGKNEKIKELNEKIADNEREIEKLKNLNSNLIRISKERANAKRGIIPKKKHIGYILLNLEEITYSFSKKFSNILCWRMKLQTPYDIMIEFDNVSKLVYNDLLSNFGSKIGIDSVFRNGTLEDYNDYNLMNEWENEKNFIFKTILKANVIKGFWEVEYMIKKSIKIIPDILFPESKKC